eukprot:1750802-Heterocapsa_arctica.AAC.1
MARAYDPSRRNPSARSSAPSGPSLHRLRAHRGLQQVVQGSGKLPARQNQHGRSRGSKVQRARPGTQ